MNATVEVKSNDAYTLPEDAVVRFENKHYVFLKKGGNEFQMTEVTVGNTENGFIEILNAEDFASQELAIRGAYSILMSLKNKSEE